MFPVSLMFQPGQFRGQLTDISAPDCVQSNGHRGKCYRYEECGRAFKKVKKFDVCEFSPDLRTLTVCCDDLSKSTYNIYREDETWSQVSQTSDLNLVTDFECGVRIANRDLLGAFYSQPDPDDPGAQLVKALALMAARDGTHPWMAALWFKHRLICGGSIINRRTILTSAHCFKFSKDANDYSVTLGSINLSQGRRFTVAKLISHPGYRSPSVYNNIALIILDESLRFDWRVNPVCLAFKHIADPMLVAQKAAVIGFGDSSGTNSKILQEISVPLVGASECSAIYKPYRKHFPQGFTNEFICAGYTEGGKDACSGDSGGPMTIKHYSKVIQIGIVTYGLGCGLPGYPGVYTSVAYHYRWILENSL